MPLSNLQLTPQFVQAVRDAVDVHEIAAGTSTRAAAIRRLWQRAPMAECLPLLLDAAGRIR